MPKTISEESFVKIKRLVEQEKNKKVRGEARLASLQDEKERIFKQSAEELGKPVKSLEELETIKNQLAGSIEDDLNKMIEILSNEGIEI